MFMYIHTKLGSKSYLYCACNHKKQSNKRDSLLVDNVIFHHQYKWKKETAKSKTRIGKRNLISKFERNSYYLFLISR